MKILPLLLARRRLIIATVILLSLAGLFSWNTMPREEDPRFPERNGLVVVSFPGTDAETVERLVVEPIEEQLAEVEGLELVESSVRAGIAVLFLELEDRLYDTGPVWDDVEDALDRARPDFPRGVGKPELDHDLTQQDAVLLAVVGSVDPLVLGAAAERVKRRLLGVEGVKVVELIADPGEQITIEYEDAVARRLGLDPGQLGQQLAARSAIEPGGVVHLGEKTVTLRPRTDFGSLREIAATQIVLPSGASLPLGELARVRHGPREPDLARMRFEGEPAVGLGVVPRFEIDRIRWGQRVRAALAELGPELAPLRIEEVLFQPDSVEHRLDELSRSLKLGILIVAGVLFLVMGLRLGFLVAMVVPLVTFSSLALYAMAGGILHQISIAALVIALGMLVDNAIVMVENIQFRLDSGETVHQAAAASVRELALPLGTATGTTLAAFVPMLLSSGGTADFTRAIPTLVMLALAVSYLFAVMVTPVLAELTLRRRPKADSALESRWAGRLADWAVDGWRWVLPATLLLLLATVFAAGFVKQQFFPGADRTLVLVDLELPEGTHLDGTDAATRLLEEAMAELPEVTSVASFIGRGTPHIYYNLTSRPRSPYLASVIVQTQHKRELPAVIAAVREFAARRVPQAEVVARRLVQGPSIPAPIEVRVYGEDLEELQLVSDQVLSLIRGIDGTRDARHDLGLGSPSVTVDIDDAAAARHGLNRASVARALYGRTLGTEIGQYRMGDDPVPILLRSAAGEDLPVAELASIDVGSPGRVPVPLEQVARLGVEWRPAAIYHRNRQRLVRVRSELTAEGTSVAVVAELEPLLAELDLAPGMHWEIGGEVAESGAANSAILRSAPIGVLLLLFFLLAEFNSFRRVGIVLMTVPLAAVGVVPGLLLTGNPFGFTSLLGMVSLVGIVVNNAIVLLDLVERNRAVGASVEEALRQAVIRRTRPILLTMSTTVAGLLPLAFSPAALWPPLAWAMISGLAASTLLTLLVIPALYRLLFSPRRRVRLRPAKVTAGLLVLLAGLTIPPARGESLDLHQAMERAAARPQALAAEERAQAAEQSAVMRRRGSLWPTLGVTLGTSWRDRDFSFATPLGELSLGQRHSEALEVRLTQPLLDVSRWLYAAPAARSQALAAASRSARLKQRLAAQAAQSFIAVLAIDARGEATATFIASLKARLEETEQRVAAGRSLEADALKLRLDLEAAEFDLLRLGEQRRVAARELGLAVGSTQPVEPLFDQVVDQRLELERQVLIDAAASSRPDILAAEAQLRAVELLDKSIAAERLPRLQAVATWSSSDGDPFQADEIGQLTVGLAWNPFAAGTRAPRRAGLAAERRALAADLEELRRSIGLEIDDGLARLAVARAAVRVRHRGVELAQETLRVERARYQAGRATTNDLLDAEAELRAQVTAQALARLEVLGSWILLRQVTGTPGLWPPPAARDQG